MNKNQKRLENTKKVKHGSLSVLLTVVVIAAVIIANVIFSAFAYNNNWYIDLTSEGVYGLTDPGRALLDTVEGDIVVHFLRPFDELEADGASKMAFELVKDMASEYDNITYDYIDIVKNYREVQKYKSTNVTSINKYHIIVESGTEFRVLALEALFVEDTDTGAIWAFDGEYKLITAMVQCTQAETPIAYFTNTHGETLSTTVIEVFNDAGYEVKPIDLTKEEISEDARFIVIANPQYDFEGISELTAGRKSEIEKLDDFLDNFGNLMVLLSPETETLPELEDFLVEWGISFDRSVVRDTANSLDADGYILSGQYSTADDLGGEIVSKIVDARTVPKVVIPNARPIDLLYEYKNNRQTSVIISSSDSAQRYTGDEAISKGSSPLVTVTRETRMIDNSHHYSHVFAIGSNYFISDAALHPSYANRDIIHNIMYVTGRAQVPIDIDFKVFDDEALVILSSQAQTLTIILTAVIPAAVLAVGTVIYIRRKRA